MFDGLLAYSLDRIESLYHFYKLELLSINKISKEGADINRLGYIADLYFYMLKTGDEDSELINRMKKSIDKIFYVKVEVRDGEKLISYRYKDIEALKKKGIETNISKAAIAYSKFTDMPIIHASNTLVMLITRFEEFISNYLIELFELYPEKYLDDKKICFAEIVGERIEDIREKIISRAVDTEMRKNYYEWFNLLEEHKMKFDLCKQELEDLKEIYVRRNVMVHNSGEASEAYLECINNTHVQLGEDLTPDEKYLDKAFTSIKTLIFFILIETCRFVDDKESYLDNIFDVAFEHLEAAQYETCMKVFKALETNKHSASDTKIMSKINYWISKKELEGLDSIVKEVEEFDVKALEKQFALAKDILLEKNESATKKLEDLYSKKEIMPNALNEWPLFMHYRNTEQFEEFKRKHSEDFVMSSFDSKQEEIVIEDGANEALIKEIEEKKLA